MDVKIRESHDYDFFQGLLSQVIFFQGDKFAQSQSQFPTLGKAGSYSSKASVLSWSIQYFEEQ